MKYQRLIGEKTDSWHAQRKGKEGWEKEIYHTTVTSI